MEDTILYTTLGMVTKRDVLFMVGDIAFDYRGLMKLKELPCRKILVRGNHDTLKTEQYMEVFDEIHGAYRYKGAFITHIPIHPMELFRGYNIHGHCHNGGPREKQIGDEWDQYYNVIVEYNNYQPVTLEQVLRTLRKEEEYLE
jgi:calcineurin-like phosphoesterase family protein